MKLYGPRHLYPVGVQDKVSVSRQKPLVRGFGVSVYTFTLGSIHWSLSVVHGTQLTGPWRGDGTLNHKGRGPGHRRGWWGSRGLDGYDW